MRIQASIVFVALAVACGGGSADGPAARVGAHTLSEDRLAEILVLAQPLPIEMRTASDLAFHWLELTLVARRAAAGDSLLDAASVRAALAPEFRELRIARLLEESAMEAASRADAMADSVYREGAVRLLAHVYRRVDPGARPGEKEFQKITAEQIHQRLVAGGAWSAAVEQSEDPDTRGRGGVIGLVRRGQLPPAFESAAFALGPGEMSGVVETDFGFHIIHRPALEEARETFVRLLAEELRAGAEAEIGAQMLAEARLAVLTDAAARTKEMGRAPWDGLGRDDLFVRYDGGRATGDDVARALLLLDPGVREALVNASDVEVDGFLREIVLRDLLAARADSAGMTADSAGTRTVLERYREVMEAVWQAADISPDSLATTSAGPEREAAIANRVNEYMDAIAARLTEVTPVPPLLTAYLLEDIDWALDTAAIGRAMESARRMVAAADAR